MGAYNQAAAGLIKLFEQNLNREPADGDATVTPG
jgi:hypothetical protein